MFVSYSNSGTVTGTYWKVTLPINHYTSYSSRTAFACYSRASLSTTGSKAYNTDVDEIAISANNEAALTNGDTEVTVSGSYPIA